MNLFFRRLTYFVVLLLFNCTSKEFSYSRFIVGGHCEIKFSYHSEKTAEKIISQIEDELVRIDSLLNRFSEKSLVSELNRNLRVKAPGDIIYLFALSDSVAQLTDGLFDISIAPLVEIWGFYKHEFKNPDSAEIEKIKKLVDYRKIRLKNDSIIIPEGMKVDLGGIAQGFAADRVKMVLKKYNVISALINIGGEIAVIGQSPKGRPWRIGIKNPRGEGIIETIELKDEALSTSGDYEKFFLINNKRYPHIINPKTGFPASDFVSVTTFAKNAAFADAIATAMAIMGPEKSLIFLDSLGIGGIIYYEENGCLQRVEKR
ncbi:FAD:protein FMN transferase [candidate division WOR-3 bacterium]|nr:FAD:protein FMN transferase [candidate division WOR-3 bacterium]